MGLFTSLRVAALAATALATLALSVTPTRTRATCAGYLPTGSTWAAPTTLDAGAGFTLSHAAVNGTWMYLRIRAQTRGWVGVGLSERGFMFGADLVTAYVDPATGETFVADRYVPWTPYPYADTVDHQPFPVRDACQDWLAVCGAVVGGATEVVVRRKITTSDGQDRAFVRGPMYTIYAWSNDGTSAVAYHAANRGSTTYTFLGTPAAYAVPADSTQYVDILSTWKLDGTVTRYVLRSDVISFPAHAVAFEAVVPPAGIPYVHHIILHDCGNVTGSPWTTYQTQGTGSSVLGTGTCTQMLFVWGKGGGSLALPSDVGLRVGPLGARYVVLELHVDNAAQLSGANAPSFTAGVRVRLTANDTYRPVEAGWLTLGSTAFPDIPASAPSTVYVSSCTSSCTSRFTGPIRFHYSFLHAHARGRRIWTKLFNSSGTFIMNNVGYYNPNFQTTDPLPIGAFTLQPGDELATYGEYDTSRVATTTTWGQGSDQEMLFDFLLFSPKASARPQCSYGGTSYTVCGSQGIIETQPKPAHAADKSFPAGYLAVNTSGPCDPSLPAVTSATKPPSVNLNGTQGPTTKSGAGAPRAAAALALSLSLGAAILALA